MLPFIHIISSHAQNIIAAGTVRLFVPQVDVQSVTSRSVKHYTEDRRSTCLPESIDFLQIRLPSTSAQERCEPLTGSQSSPRYSK